MKRFHHRHSLFLTIAVIFLLHQSAGQCFAISLGPFTFEGTGNLVYHHQLAKDKEKETLDTSEKHDATFSETLAMGSSLTPLIDYTASIRYQTTLFESPTEQTLQPAIQIDLENDIFKLGFNFSNTEQWGTYDYSTNSEIWTVSAQSNWGNRAWPSVTMSHSGITQINNTDPQTTTNSTDTTNLQLRWRIQNFTYYLYGLVQTENLTGSKQTTTRQDLTYRRGTNIWKNQIGATFSQRLEYRHQKSEQTANSQGEILSQNSLIDTRNDANIPLDTNWQDMTVNPSIKDGNRTATAFTITTLNNLNISGRTAVAVQLDLQEANLLYLYTTQELSTADTLFTWDIYTSDDGLTWTLLQANAATRYLQTEKRFEITHPDTVSFYLKLVATSTPLTDVEFSEIESWRKIITEKFTEIITSTQNSRSVSSGGLNYRYSPTLAFTSNALYSLQHFTNDEQETETTLKAGVQWNAHKYAQTGYSIVDTSKSYDVRPDYDSISHSFSINTPILPTMYHQLSLSHTKSKTQDRPETTSNSATSTTTAQLYPDLSSKLEIEYSESGGSDSVESELSFNARIIPRMHTHLVMRHKESTGFESELSLRWRPSDVISVNSSLAYYANDTNIPRSTGISLDIYPSRKTQFRTAYIYSSDGRQSYHSYSALFNWNINRIMSWRTSGNYSFTDPESTWTVDSYLTAKIDL